MLKNCVSEKKTFIILSCFRLCLHPLLHDLNSTSFIRRASNSNYTLENLNDKAVSASKIDVTSSSINIGFNLMNLSKTTIEIRLPKEMLIRGIWWSAPDPYVYVQNFEKTFLFNSQFSTWNWYSILNMSKNTKNSSAKNVTPIMFPVPIITNSLRLENLIYYDSTRNSDKIPLQIELFGCEEYQLDEGMIFRGLVVSAVETNRDRKFIDC
jgi:hypothetical protein